MFNTKQTIAAVAAVAVIAVGGVWANNSNNNEVVETPEAKIVQQETSNSTISFSEDKKIVSYEGQDDKTALEVLKELTEVTTDTASFGEFVTGINGLEADSSSQYWSFYVDGDYASEGAGTYQSSNGEKLEWRLEEL